MGSRKILVSLFIVILFLEAISCTGNNYKGNVLKNAYIVNNTLYVQLDHNNGKVGKIKRIEVGKNIPPAKVTSIENSEGLITIMSDLEENFINYKNFEHYEIYVSWFGGGLTADSVYQDGRFHILKEKYNNGR